MRPTKELVSSLLKNASGFPSRYILRVLYGESRESQSIQEQCSDQHNGRVRANLITVGLLTMVIKSLGYV
jgi:hypothetical protein